MRAAKSGVDDGRADDGAGMCVAGGEDDVAGDASVGEFGAGGGVCGDGNESRGGGGGTAGGLGRLLRRRRGGATA